MFSVVGTPVLSPYLSLKSYQNKLVKKLISLPKLTNLLLTMQHLYKYKYFYYGRIWNPPLHFDSICFTKIPLLPLLGGFGGRKGFVREVINQNATLLQCKQYRWDKYQLRDDTYPGERKGFAQLGPQRGEEQIATHCKHNAGNNCVDDASCHHGNDQRQYCGKLVRFGIFDKNLAHHANDKAIGRKFKYHWKQPIGEKRSATCQKT